MKNDRLKALPGSKHKAVILALLSAGYILAACGGGGGTDAGTGSTAASSSSATGPGSTGSNAGANSTPATSTPSTTLSQVVAKGAVTALAGVTVNNVRYDDRNARVQVNGKNGRLDDLRLGMVVEIEAERNNGTSFSTAKTIHVHSFAQGTVQAIDRVLQKITVMGIVISIPSTTVFEGFSGLGDVSFKVGDLVEVHGLAAGVSSATATRIEKKTATAVAGLEDLHITGAVTQLNTVLKTFLIGETTIAYSNATLDSFNGGLVNGIMVRVEGVSVGPKIVKAKEVESADLSTAAREGFSVDQEGIITNYDAASATFKVNGMSVNASAARMDGILVNQGRVKVSGVIVDGVLKATKVERTDQAEGSVDGDVAKVAGAIKLGKGSFQIGSITVTWNTNTRFDDVTPQTLRDNQVVEVEAVRSGDVYIATRIKADK